MGMAGVIYKYIEYRGAEKEWGDGIRGNEMILNFDTKISVQSNVFEAVHLIAPSYSTLWVFDELRIGTQIEIQE